MISPGLSDGLVEETTYGTAAVLICEENQVIAANSRKECFMCGSMMDRRVRCKSESENMVDVKKKETKNPAKFCSLACFCVCLDFLTCVLASLLACPCLLALPLLALASQLARFFFFFLLVFC